LAQRLHPPTPSSAKTINPEAFMQATSAMPMAAPTAQGHHRRPLFKSDYPRTIDRYIDYFGGVPAAEDSDDTCGETLLDRLA
jgi:hypothetical protein